MICEECGKEFERLNQGEYIECGIGHLCNSCIEKSQFADKVYEEMSSAEQIRLDDDYE